MLLTKELLHTTDAHIKKLKAGGLETTEDLLLYFPRNLEDRSEVLESFTLVQLKEKNTLRLTIESIVSERTRSGKTLTKVILKDIHGYFSEAVYFTKPYFLSKYASGDVVLLHGKAKYDYGKLSFPAPEIELASSVETTLVPIYSDCQYIPGSWFEGKISYVRPYLSEISEVLPAEIRRTKGFRARALNIESLHFPRSPDDFERARRELAYEELYAIQYRGLAKKYDARDLTNGKSPVIPLRSDLIKELLTRLPYELTGKQKIVLFQILRDMEAPFAMTRLLQGDVGTGKTVVAFLAIIHAIREAGIQCVCMAPTEILARQHFEGFLRDFWDLGIRVDLLVGSLTATEKKSAKARLKSGETDLIIGTHALIEDDVVFKNLGFVIVDEQHRFGVNQRKVLEEYFSVHGEVFPHSLNMTATPIPRTLALTFSGDQDISILNEYPASRKPIHTKVIPEHQREDIYRMVESEVAAGRQVYWISPLVTESETLDVANAVQTAETLRMIFPHRRIGLIHGKLKASEKEAIMQSFYAREIDILSSTSVVEVGVNNPNASIMCIEAAERFWLSQLHQFRGRVGRWSDQSYCYLFTTKSYTGERLRALEKSNDGFVLSEIDLELRWPGEVYGLRQSGVPELKIASLQDLELVSEIREDIISYLEKNPKKQSLTSL